ncbi:triose-phosphate isomerase [Alienimonas chondri]|uniref:Triosephosphate isomerase n=1 Tax=Alienimonas chondri TaxID=2681879 RepID=A0ABX1V8K6_9PLAN|nr:triose-phosphate isomerase [Alienimonas chondri]NNJ24474.1 Triosephosphate isomerase [Alienimonas chondri]
MRRPFVAGNWKMNTTAASGCALAREIAAAVPTSRDAVDVLVAPPLPYLDCVDDELAKSAVMLGAQNCYHEKEGAFTGEVSPQMLADLDVDYVILGHSERRHVLGETDADVNKKVAAALAAGLGVILCVGETLEQREAGETEKVLAEQLSGGLAGLTAEQFTAGPGGNADLVLAYEPVWAIGTGKTATPEMAQEAHAFLRSKLAEGWGDDLAAETRIQYGGSVKPANAADLLAQPDVDGALVGGASLTAENFLPIIEAAFALV